jgi:hypothetical protein
VSDAAVSLHSMTQSAYGTDRLAVTYDALNPLAADDRSDLALTGGQPQPLGRAGSIGLMINPQPVVGTRRAYCIVGNPEGESAWTWPVAVHPSRS